MDNTQREHLRLSLLRFCGENNTRWGFPLGFLHARAVDEGRTGLAPAAVESEMDYLADKGLVSVPEKLISPENRAWRITAAGRDHLATRGLPC
jgi:hypothetical protein